MAWLAAIDLIRNQATAERNELERFWLQQLDGWETGQLLLGVVIHESFWKLHFTIISGVSCVMFHPISLLLFGTSRWMPAMPTGSDLEIVKAKDLSSFNRIYCMTLRLQQLFRHVTQLINTPNSYQSKLAMHLGLMRNISKIGEILVGNIDSWKNCTSQSYLPGAFRIRAIQCGFAIAGIGKSWPGSSDVKDWISSHFAVPWIKAFRLPGHHQCCLTTCCLGHRFGHGLNVEAGGIKS